MARITTVKSARATPMPRVCRRCSYTIQVGDTYRYFKKRYGGTSIYCEKHHPRASEMTSGKTAALLAIGEGLEEGMKAASVEDLASALETAAGEAENLADEYQESADNIVEGFGHETFMSEELQEKADEVREWAEALSSAATEAGDLEVDESEKPEPPDQQSFDSESAYDKAHEEWEAEVEEWHQSKEDELLEEAQGHFEEALSAQP